eukprot:CAMPEP_0179032360 /NCGR_PEP_ID=MMETSP0796-20121207/11542_1 /TAXON_ID=73915 /ORGANISM="Pyrodinium bahamense, Strain pbaha01" /LENGTH=183 /DNA_ID=CAMNT_0020728573 /DNA_START=906 /DNA_END=1457 /DNA_ORIENTATION=+
MVTRDAGPLHKNLNPAITTPRTAVVLLRFQHGMAPLHEFLHEWFRKNPGQHKNLIQWKRSGIALPASVLHVNQPRGEPCKCTNPTPWEPLEIRATPDDPIKSVRHHSLVSTDHSEAAPVLVEHGNTLEYTPGVKVATMSRLSRERRVCPIAGRREAAPSTMPQQLFAVVESAALRGVMPGRKV